MKNNQSTLSDIESGVIAKDSCNCQSVDWYSEGQTRIIDVDGVQITIRFIGRRGRRGRIAVTAPAGAAFYAVDKISHADGNAKK